MSDELKAFWRSKPKEDAEKAFDRAMIAIMLLKFIGTIVVYMLLKSNELFNWAELWLIAIYAFTLKSNMDLSSLKLKEQVMERIGYGKEIAKEDIEQEPKEDTNQD